MNHLQEFALIQDFLSLFEPRPPIELRDGESESPLSEPTRRLLERIARGEASRDDRDEALPLLLKDSKALAFLAQQLNQG